MAEEEDKANEAKDEKRRELWFAKPYGSLWFSKVQMTKIPVEERTNNSVMAFGVGRRQVRKSFH